MTCALPILTRTLPALLVPALLLLAAGAQAADESSSRREPPRIIFGQTEQTEFEFREIRPLRSSGASTRQAYFGSGASYSETLSRLQAQMSAIRARTELDRLELTPAQEIGRASCRERVGQYV